MGKMVDLVKIVWIYLFAVIDTLVFFGPALSGSLFLKFGDLTYSSMSIWGRFLIRSVGAQMDIHGLSRIKKGQAYVILANHQSLFDIPALLSVPGWKFRWVIKKELLKIPIFGWTLYLTRNIFVDRSNRKAALESINRGVKRLPQGAGIFFFPEGTRSGDGQFLPFKKGGFVLAIQTGLPILPVVVNGSRKVLAKGSVVFHSGPIQIRIGQPIETRNLSMDDLDDLMARTRETMLGLLDPDYPQPRASEAPHLQTERT